MRKYEKKSAFFYLISFIPDKNSVNPFYFINEETDRKIT